MAAHKTAKKLWKTRRERTRDISGTWERGATKAYGPATAM
jgi:hypothetical protein